MKNIVDISKEEFIEVYNKYSANGFIRFMYRWFNTNTLNKPYPLGTWFALLCFVVATTGIVIFDKKNSHVAKAFVFVLLAFFLFILTLPAYLMNQYRIKKICKELKITTENFNILSNIYLNK